MALSGYEVPIDWIPDAKYINTPPDAEYLAWRLATNPVLGTALWVIEQVADTTSVDLVDLLPKTYIAIDVDKEITAYGYTRHMAPTLNILDLQSHIDDQVALTQLEF